MQVIPPPIKKIVDEWNIRGLMILSLLFQTSLIFFAPMRKRTSNKWVAVVLWTAYLLADSTAIYAVSQITKNQGEELEHDDDDPPKNKKLLALWAPFLLLHLGGPDTITALALEDNALWKRHLFSLVSQALACVYAMVQSMENVLWPPITLLFITGTIKYVERSLALYSASLEKLKNSMQLPPDYKIMEEYASRKEANLPINILLIQEPDKQERPRTLFRPDRDLTDLEIVQYGFKFFNTFKGLVVDLVFSPSVRDESRDFFNDLQPGEALRIIESELDFLYELMYTKAAILHTITGALFRFIAFGSLLSALYVFHHRPLKSRDLHREDVVITYILFIVGIALDLASMFMFLFSDWTFAVFRKLKDDPDEKNNSIDSLFNWFLAFRKQRWKKHTCNGNQTHEVLTTRFLSRRWSGTIHGFNLLGFCLKAKVSRIHQKRNCSLTDMRTHGPIFTWCNKRQEGLIYKKLDRVLQNPPWQQSFPNSYCLMESGGCSDHLRGRFYLSANFQKPKAPFKFTNAISTQPEFIPKLESFWRDSPELFHSTTALFRFSKKLKMLKPILRELSRQKLSDISRRAEDAYDDLCAKQLASFSTVSASAVAAESVAFVRWEKVADLEERFLRQRSKLHWLQVGDKNNKFFHNGVKARQAMNSIYEITDPNGVSLTTASDIKTEAVRFFSSLLTSLPADFTGCSVARIQELLDFRCSPQQQSTLIADVSYAEVKKVIFSMPANKSPGPDGYTVEFFKEAWSVVGADFTVAVQSFFKYGFLPKGVNSTILALIPKKTDSREMKDYRPISCCNVLYKVISKIIANRLKKILPSFIAPNQSAFIKDRLLMENLLLATELVKDYHKEEISPRGALKIDISKAFDSVQWPFLLNVLTALNFPESFIHWIQLCVTTASFSVQVNGELSGYFNSERGLRQGCSLSPYLFVICMNVLSAMLDKAAAAHRIGFHPGCKNLKITHLCFADDIMVFSDGKSRSIEGILEIFNEFAALSGLQISLEKSTLFLAGQSVSACNSILERFPFDYGSLPVRYLGLPLMTKRMSLADCMPLLEKIRARISSWKHRFLSYGGRLQLLISVIASLTNFWISAFRLPSACIKEIEKLCSAFLWSGPELNSRKAKIAWVDVCKPKNEGGLGLKSIGEANKVSCFKLIWKIVSRTPSLWVNWIQNELIRTGSFWSIKENTMKGSWMWRKLLKYRLQAKTFHMMEVRNGSTTSFWYDNWSPLGRLSEVLGDRGVIDMGIPADATIATALRRRRRRHRAAVLNQIETELDKVRTGDTSDDVALWRSIDGTFKPRFTTSDTWAQIRMVAQDNNWHKGVWFSGATPKFSFLLWLAVHNRLSTGERMLAWNSGVNSECVFCGHHVETRDHLFFQCRFSTSIWTKLTRKLLCTRFSTSFSALLYLLAGTTLSGSLRFILRYVFQATIYSLWQERNNRRHGEVPLSSDRLISAIDRLVRNRITSFRRMHPSKITDAYSVWIGSRT